ncbi:MAG: hypothetical protein HC828_03785 [Blastochloris sp.]|nr:hypothetical protein [Blastochloris sp.]
MFKYMCVLIAVACFWTACSSVVNESPMPWEQQIMKVLDVVAMNDQEHTIAYASARPMNISSSSLSEIPRLQTTLILIAPIDRNLASAGMFAYPSIDATFQRYDPVASLQTKESGIVYREESFQQFQEAVKGITVGPEEVLESTFDDGIAHLGIPLDATNTRISLMLLGDPFKLYDVPAIWQVSFEGQSTLQIIINAWTGQEIERVMR